MRKLICKEIPDICLMMQYHLQSDLAKLVGCQSVSLVKLLDPTPNL